MTFYVHIIGETLKEVWKQMLNSSWCGLLAALSLLLEARSVFVLFYSNTGRQIIYCIQQESGQGEVVLKSIVVLKEVSQAELNV